MHSAVLLVSDNHVFINDNLLNVKFSYINKISLLGSGLMERRSLSVLAIGSMVDSLLHVAFFN